MGITGLVILDIDCGFRYIITSNINHLTNHNLAKQSYLSYLLLLNLELDAKYV